MNISKELTELFDDKKIDYKTDEIITSTFRIYAQAALTLYPDTAQKLIACLDILQDNNIKFHVLGNGSNVLFGFKYFEGAIVFTHKMSEITVCGEYIHALAGVHLSSLAMRACTNGLEGLAFAQGIPGRVGGSVHMNAGAYGSCLSEVLESSVAYDVESKKIRKLSWEEHRFGYRESIYMQNPQLICVEATFALSKGDAATITADIREKMRARRESQPLDFPSAGSYFKRPEGHFAGKLIEDAGLKGLTVGGARVSQKHAGFIINVGDATAEDVLKLEEIIKEEVMSRFGVVLEREVRLIV